MVRCGDVPTAFEGQLDHTLPPAEYHAYLLPPSVRVNHLGVATALLR